jgi:DNA adenine methylase
MKYMGSKARIAKHILPIMLEEANKHGITKWVEPFVGGANMIDKVPSKYERVGYDLNPHTIAALVGIRDNANGLPDAVSEEEYKSLYGSPAGKITSLIRFGASFGGKFENGYARRNGLSMWGECVRNSKKQSPKIQNVQFICDSYENLSFENCLIYCDPPYQGTTGYKTGAFDHDKFFDWCREQAKKNVVFVSEYNAPDDFECVWEGEVKTNFASTRKKATHNAVEKLFKVNPK